MLIDTENKKPYEPIDVDEHLRFENWVDDYLNKIFEHQSGDAINLYVLMKPMRFRNFLYFWIKPTQCGNV